MKTDAMPDLTLPLATRLFGRGLQALTRIPDGLIALLARLSMAAVFWQSGQTKVDGWALSDNALYLFENEYRLPLIDPRLAAYLAAFAEHAFPALLVIGLASRLSALALLAMTLVIQLFVYPGAWPTHGTWAACLLFIAARGPGVLSLDTVLLRTILPPSLGRRS